VVARLILSFLLLVAHVFRSDKILVDNTTIILLVVLLVCPFAAAVRKIKFGGLEAEIDPKEVNKVATEAERSLANAPARPDAPPTRPEAVKAIEKLAETDLVIALAKLRIELETRLRKLHERAGHADGAKPKTMLQMIRDLQADAALPPSMGTAIRDVMNICNRAIHGQDIRDEDARRIIDAGTALLEEVDAIASQHSATTPMSKDVVSVAELERALGARYRVTTIVPYVKHPSAVCMR